MRLVPALWELYDGKRLVGWVEKVYSGRRPWTFSAASERLGENEERFASKAAAVSALKRCVRTGKV
jgi:hypothetical protein